MTQDQETGKFMAVGLDNDAAPVAGEDPAMSRILRRETHSSRAGAAVIAAVLVIILCVYALLEAGVRAVGQPPWLVDPTTAAERIIALPEGISPLLLGASGAVVAMVGLFFLLHAVLPGRRARHLLRDPRTAVVVDDEVLASALARRARMAANVTQEQVMVVVSRQTVVVNVRPTSGSRVSHDAVLAAVQAELEEMSPVPMPTVRVNLASSGVIGA
ncbi:MULTISPECIES: DUF6286 domain-containing protein [Paenarthrobacter]|jgi:hypothetical protein|uniref:DUF6286 domain-containing protein n=1 Tax=Paenarthrobacter TaxID=1742992 RepID=UPI000363DECA|nr:MULTISPECIES: DUF6286 domain-containing protein [Paenarthrobacter]KIA74831.1 hypothetical protein ANMWB30_04160 [Arthrobacter sp. MWB30]KQR02710.1 hypothetical protein ASF74_18870 [Arthrobacter sp. Leaf145]SKC05105.1 hypothetical protein SAMN05660916_04139 [Arthrobacter sp. 31Cvi3.1E]BCW09132.1 hypothetical protein NtRootA2_04140 [Arthrobacter sp. NtRootA2]BCW13212.1 hypothetical protein NtRootA4_01910 [Arthrobacter sp. NtRootA4]BCW21548.1 hypothetical protein NtRootC7_04150 [Arthrobacter 